MNQIKKTRSRQSPTRVVRRHVLVQPARGRDRADAGFTGGNSATMRAAPSHPPAARPWKGFGSDETGAAGDFHIRLASLVNPD
jgi:hypothetical protein